MPNLPLDMSPAYLIVIRGLHELHELTVRGRLDSSEADAVRDATDEIWQTLTDIEKQRVRGLSEDLYSITELRVEPIMGSRTQIEPLIDEICQARRNGNWDRIFELLREWRGAIDPKVLSSLRAHAWLDAGDRSTARIFLKHALGSEIHED